MLVKLLYEVCGRTARTKDRGGDTGMAGARPYNVKVSIITARTDDLHGLRAPDSRAGARVKLLRLSRAR